MVFDKQAAMLGKEERRPLVTMQGLALHIWTQHVAWQMDYPVNKLTRAPIVSHPVQKHGPRTNALGQGQAGAGHAAGSCGLLFGPLAGKPLGKLFERCLMPLPLLWILHAAVLPRLHPQRCCHTRCRSLRRPRTRGNAPRLSHGPGRRLST